MENNIDQKVETMNENSIFSFGILYTLIAICKSISKLPITLTQIFGNSKFLTKAINDLSFTSEPIIQKNGRMTQIDESLFRRILSKLDSLSETIES